MNIFKKDFRELIMSGKIIPEDLNMLQNISNDKRCHQNLMDRQETFKSFLEAFLKPENKLIFVEAESGAGKTEFLQTLHSYLEDGVLGFYYECSEITNLDDIILALFNFLKGVAVKDSEYRRNFKVNSYLSIDEKIINNIKKLKRPLLITIDALDRLLNSDKSLYNDLEILISYLSNINNIRVVITSTEIPRFEKIKRYEKINLGRLEKQKIYRILKNSGIDFTEEAFQEIYVLSQGKPESLLYFINLVKTYQVRPEVIISQYMDLNKSFEEFAIEKLYESIPNDLKKIIHFFCAIRHSVSLNTLKKLDFFKEIEAKLELLISGMIVFKNNRLFYIKNEPKKVLYSKISIEEKKEIHKLLEDFYSFETSKKLEDRILVISRKLLHSEQSYHYLKLIELERLTGNNFEDKHSGSNSQKEKNDLFKINMMSDDININAQVDIPITVEQEHLPEKVSENEEKFDRSEPGILAGSGIEKLTDDIEYFKQVNDKKKINEFLFDLAGLYNDSFNHNTALTYFYDILKSDPKSLPQELKLKTLNNIAGIHSYRGDFNSALNFYSRALQEVENSNDLKSKSEILFKIALTYDDLGEARQAEEYYKKNICTSTDININPYIAASFANTASISEEKNNIEKAIELYKKSIEFDTRANNLEDVYETLSRLGNIYFESGNLEKAYTNFKGELDIARKINDPYKIAMSYIDLGDIYSVKKDYQKALKSFIIAKKSIENTLSTDSKEKINLRIKKIQIDLGEEGFKKVIEEIKTKNG